jgi:hypothetical protein
MNCDRGRMQRAQDKKAGRSFLETIVSSIALDDGKSLFL